MILRLETTLDCLDGRLDRVDSNLSVCLSDGSGLLPLGNRSLAVCRSIRSDYKHLADLSGILDCLGHTKSLDIIAGVNSFQIRICSHHRRCDVHGFHAVPVAWLGRDKRQALILEFIGSALRARLRSRVSCRTFDDCDFTASSKFFSQIFCRFLLFFVFGG